MKTITVWLRTWLKWSVHQRIYGFAPAALAMAGLCVALNTLAQPAPPALVYVDASYPASGAGPVTFPATGGTGTHYLGVDAFNTIQAGVNHAAAGATVYVAAGNYVENITIATSLTLLGPNAGRPGAGPRLAEATIRPAFDDPEDTPIISVEASHVALDGFLLDGSNASLSGGYLAGSVVVHAAAGAQNGVVNRYLADVDHLTVQNNIIRNVSYDGVYLDRYGYPDNTAHNYIVNNKFDTMWEGLLTYGVHSVIASNLFVNVNHGLSVHGITNAAPAGFTPVILSNTLSIAGFSLADVSRMPGIWVNYRRDKAGPFNVVGNVVNTPTAAADGKSLLGLYALSIADGATVNFIGNIVNGGGHCQQGAFIANCPVNGAVVIQGGALNDLNGTGVLTDTVDPTYGSGDAFVTVSNVVISPGVTGTGVLAYQESSTPGKLARVTVLGSNSIAGAAVGVQVRGHDAAVTVKNSSAAFTGSRVAVAVDGGRALIENSDLTGCAVAGILATNNALVDAGDCQGANWSGLGTGSGANGSSAGGNNLSGYILDSAAPWAIQNCGTTAVTANQNYFGALPGENIALAVSGPVTFSQAGGLLVGTPDDITIDWTDVLPAGVTTLAGFFGLNGMLSANSVASISCADTPAEPPPGACELMRTYRITDVCGQVATCQQAIHVLGPGLPAIMQPPRSRINIPGSTASFTVVATNSAPLTYQWRRNGEPISGATGATLTLEGVLGADAGSYTVVVSNVAGCVTSAPPAVLTVPDPFIAAHPADTVGVLGSPLLLSVTALGTPVLCCQWQKDMQDIPGATGSSYMIESAGLTDAGNYRVIISNPLGTEFSRTARLTVTEQPVLSLVAYTNGTAVVSVRALAGRTVALLGSLDLVTWAGLETNSVPFMFLEASGGATRFYRARYEP